MKAAENTNAPGSTGAKGLPNVRAENIVVQEVEGVKARPRHVDEVVAADALARAAASDPDPMRALHRVACLARTFLQRRGVR